MTVYHDGLAFWTPAKNEECLKLWRDGLSGREIALRIGAKSRSAVLGKIHRAKQAERPTPARPKMERAPKPPKPPRAPRAVAAPKPRRLSLRVVGNGAIVIGSVAQAPRATISATAFDPLPGVQPVALLDTQPHHCRWPIDLPGLDHHVCGATAFGTYCAVHTKAAAPRDGTKENVDRKLGIVPRRRAA